MEIDEREMPLALPKKWNWKEIPFRVHLFLLL